MKAPKCRDCNKAHWPSHGCSVMTCLGCVSKADEIEALKVRIEYLQGDELVKLAEQGAARRKYQREYMRSRR